MILARLRAWARVQPEAVAIVDGEARITYQQLLESTSAVGAHLAAVAGIREGDCVALPLPNCRQFVTAFLALADRGAISIPIHTQWRPPELAWVARKVGVKAVITSQELRAAWEEVAKGERAPTLVMAENLESLAGAPIEPGLASPAPSSADGASNGEASTGSRPTRGGSAVPAERGPRDDTITLYLTTSGSTGTPRIVPRTHRMLVTGARNTGEFLGITPGTRFLGAVPFYHANGFSNCMLLPLLRGGTLVVLRRFTPGGLVDLVVREAIEVLIGSPAMFSLLVDHRPPRQAFSTVTHCLSSGAPMPAALRAACADQLGLHVRQLYGSTETGVVAIEPSGPGDDRAGRHPPGPSDNRAGRHPPGPSDNRAGLRPSGPGDDRAGRRAPVSAGPSPGDVGLPLPSVEIRIVDETGRDLPEGEIGEVLVRAPTAMAGYLGEPAPDRPGWPAGFLSMGDSGLLDARGHLILAGRRRRVINLAGIKVDPSEVERVLRELPQVHACRVLAAADRHQLEIVKAVIAVSDGAVLTRTEVVAHCRSRLAEYKIPRVIEFVEAMPADLAGKGPVVWEV